MSKNKKQSEIDWEDIHKRLITDNTYMSAMYFVISIVMMTMFAATVNILPDAQQGFEWGVLAFILMIYLLIFIFLFLKSDWLFLPFYIGLALSIKHEWVLNVTSIYFGIFLGLIVVFDIAMYLRRRKKNVLNKRKRKNETKN